MSDRSKAFKYERLAAEIIRLIESGTFRPGDRIPSVRQLSRQKGVSITTVMQTYYLLEAQGWIEARPRSGFYVHTLLPSAHPEPAMSSPSPDPAQVSVREMVTRIVLADTKQPDLVQLGAAHPNPQLAATKKLNRSLTSVARRMGARSGMYEYVPGCEALRSQIARRALAAGCSLSPDDVVITTGVPKPSACVCGRSVVLAIR